MLSPLYLTFIALDNKEGPCEAASFPPGMFFMLSIYSSCFQLAESASAFKVIFLSSIVKESSSVISWTSREEPGLDHSYCDSIISMSSCISDNAVGMVIHSWIPDCEELRADCDMWGSLSKTKEKGGGGREGKSREREGKGGKGEHDRLVTCLL